MAPLTLLPAGGGRHHGGVLSLIAFVAALWIVGVRDWRVYGASFLWPPVIGEMRTAHLTLVLCLLLAVAWRDRDRFPIAGPHARRRARPQVLPLAARALARGAAEVARRRDRRGASPSPRSCSLLPFISLPEYARLLRRLGATFDQDSFTPFGLLVQAGRVRSRRARSSASRSASPSSRSPGGAQSFVLFVAAALLLSPIVWLDYFAAPRRSRSRSCSRACRSSWLLPILTWGITSAGAGVGHVEHVDPRAGGLHGRDRAGGPQRGTGSRAAARATRGGAASDRRSRPMSASEAEPMTRRALDVLADNSLLVLVFCAIGALLLAAFAPDTVVGDTWMTLVAGREIVDHGLPHVDHLTIYGAGRTWTDQQWLAHLVLYGSERLGGFGLVTFVSGLSVMLAYAIALVAVRARGATTRATLLVFIVVAVRRSLDLDGARAGARAAPLRRRRRARRRCA